MLDNNFFSTISTSVVRDRQKNKSNREWLVLGAAAFLVSVPVFIQAPLVRVVPSVSLLLTFVWLYSGYKLLSIPKTKLWGDLIIGFSWSWLAGSIYWGWLRTDPLIHLPIEAIGLPFALWCCWRGHCLVGNLFYLGSLFGTCITDLYFYVVGLIPYWRKIMTIDPELVGIIFKQSIIQVQTPWGITWAIILATVLLFTGLLSLQKPQLHWWAFGGAILSTIVVDSLFFIAASLS
ncbi:MAG: DUF3120 domain-containing protein [Prochloraceae cyanobacterium]|nr:DUF3120 domain-containing protein [Prochloraceae cyanobacterium]